VQLYKAVLLKCTQQVCAATYKRGPNKIFSNPFTMGIKTHNFILISKRQTYLSDKMHPKEVIPKNMLNLDFNQK
jgi:hypothetical protein